MRLKIALAALALTSLCAGSALADNLAVPLDHSARLAVRGAASVVVGNPSVADVTVVDSRTVYVSGRNFGSTDVIVLDRDGRAIYSGDVTVTRSASEVSVYRGAERTDFACAPTCSKNQRTAGATASSPLSALFAGMSAPTPGASKP